MMMGKIPLEPEALDYYDSRNEWNEAPDSDSDSDSDSSDPDSEDPHPLRRRRRDRRPS